MLHLLDRIRQGQAAAGETAILNSVAKGIQGKCLCALGDFAAGAVSSAIERFPADFSEREIA